MNKAMSQSLSEDNQYSPECLMTSEPVRDPYSTDEEQNGGEKERMLDATAVQSSEVYPWEVCHYLGVVYHSYESEKDLQDISSKGLFTECLKFLFPSGLPSAYISLFKIKSTASWKSAAAVLYKHFMDREDIKWLKKHWTIDFTHVNKDNIQHVNNSSKSDWKYWILCNRLENPNMPAYFISARFSQVLMYIREDQEKRRGQNSKQIRDEDYMRKREKLKGLLNDIVAYLHIHTLYNGESNVDFQHKVVDRNDTVEFKVKSPDLTLCTLTADVVGGISKIPEEPYAIIEVFGASEGSVREQSELVKATNRKGDINKEVSNSSSNAGCKNSVQETNKDELNKIVLGKRQHCENGETLSIFDNDKLRNSISEQVTSCGPLFCKTGCLADELYGQMALQLYGALIQKYRSFEKQPGGKDDMEAEDQVVGFFIIDEFVVMAKMSQMLRCLQTDHYLRYTDHGPRITYAKNLVFDLKIPRHRLAFLCLLFHYNLIQETEKQERWKDKVKQSGYVKDVEEYDDSDDDSEDDDDPSHDDSENS